MKDAKELVASFCDRSERSQTHNVERSEKTSENAAAEDEDSAGGDLQALPAAEAAQEEAKRAEEHPNVEEHEVPDQDAQQDGQLAAKEDAGEPVSI